jgi:hypothetical protein
MSKLEMLIEEAEEAPEEVLSEVLDFLRFLKIKQDAETAQIDLSKTAFGQDWDATEEDEAWRDL